MSDPPDLQTLQHLAAVLKLPVAYFYAEDDELAQLIAEFKGRSEPQGRSAISCLGKCTLTPVSMVRS
jgi:transcriptional regulator with XRE-family HTH domain